MSIENKLTPLVKAVFLNLSKKDEKEIGRQQLQRAFSEILKNKEVQRILPKCGIAVKNNLTEEEYKLEIDRSLTECIASYEVLLIHSSTSDLKTREYYKVINENNLASFVNNLSFPEGAMLSVIADNVCSKFRLYNRSH